MVERLQRIQLCKSKKKKSSKTETHKVHASIQGNNRHNWKRGQKETYAPKGQRPSNSSTGVEFRNEYAAEIFNHANHPRTEEMVGISLGHADGELHFPQIKSVSAPSLKPIYTIL
jgi:hypothetical protein